MRRLAVIWEECVGLLLMEGPWRGRGQVLCTVRIEEGNGRGLAEAMSEERT